MVLGLVRYMSDEWKNFKSHSNTTDTNIVMTYIRYSVKNCLGPAKMCHFVWLQLRIKPFSTENMRFLLRHKPFLPQRRQRHLAEFFPTMVQCPRCLTTRRLVNIRTS